MMFAMDRTSGRCCPSAPIKITNTLVSDALTIIIPTVMFATWLSAYLPLHGPLGGVAESTVPRSFLSLSLIKFSTYLSKQTRSSSSKMCTKLLGKSDSAIMSVCSDSSLLSKADFTVLTYVLHHSEQVTMGMWSRTSGDTKLQLDQKDVLLLGLHQKGQCSSHVGVTRIFLRASPEGIDHTTSASIQLPEIRECRSILGYQLITSGGHTPPLKMSGNADS
ncbi:hypothetical protein GQR58_009705 [Nymphon striatum]|nr:hypothetical protein GQR58_009705 [Nymphon striatum]